MIKASEIGTQIYAILVESVESTMEGETPEAKQEAILAILQTLSKSV